MRLVFLSYLIVMIACGCKSNVSRSRQNESPQTGMIKYDLVSFFKPESTDDSPSSTLDQVRSLLKQKNIDLSLPSQVESMRISNSETLFYVKDGDTFVPILSVDSGKMYEWSILAPMRLDPSGSNQISDSNIVYRSAVEVELENDSSTADSIPFFVYADENGKPIVSKLADHAITAFQSLRRFRNSFYNESGGKVMELKTISPQMWRLEGQWDDGILCGGSVLWQEGEKFYAATSRFGKVSQYLWEDAGDHLQIKGILMDVKPPQAVSDAIQPCHHGGADDVKNMLSNLKYDESFQKMEDFDGQAASEYDFDPKSFRLGKLVRFPGSTEVWVLLEHLSASSPVIVTNHSRTYPEDGGQQYTRVFAVYKSATTTRSRKSFRELGFVKDYLVSASIRIQEKNDDRVSGVHLAAQYMERQAAYMKIVEAKAKAVGAGMGEWYKPVMNAFAVAISDAAAQVPVKNAPKSVLGVNVDGNSLANAALALSNRRERLVAAAYTTALQGLSLSTKTVSANLETATLDELRRSSLKNVGATGIILGLRSWFPKKHPLSVPVVGLSGFVMRWRKLDNERELGYENQNQALNVIAGGAQAIAQTLAASKGPGVVNSIGNVGLLLSETISGRGTPGVIAGTVIETGTELLVQHRLIRPFALVLAGQVSALIQIGDAWRVGQETSEKLEGLRQIRVEQVQKFNSVLHLLRKRQDLLATMTVPELQIVTSTLADPFAGLKNAMGQQN